MTDVGENVLKLKIFLCTVGGNVNHAAAVETVRWLLKKLKKELPMIQQLYFCVYTQKY